MAGNTNNARRDEFEGFDDDAIDRFELSDRSDEPTSLEDRLTQSSSVPAPSR